MYNIALDHKGFFVKMTILYLLELGIEKSYLNTRRCFCPQEFTITTLFTRKKPQHITADED